MKILIISDTHRKHENLLKVLERECPVDLLAFGSTVFFGKMKSVIIIFKRVNHEKHLLGVKLVQADLPDDTKYQQTKTDAQPTV